MSLSEWLRDSHRRLRTNGAQGAVESVRELWVGGLRRINEVYPNGENVYTRDWDLLVVVDGCRTDLMREVEDDWSFLDNGDQIVSVGSSSIQWLEETFRPAFRAEVQSTAYVTANPFSHRVPELDNLAYLDELWRYAFDENAGTVPAAPVTDRAIRAGRQQNCSRLVVHYMQPHFPSIPDPLGGSGMNPETLGEGAGWDSPWDSLRRGDIEYDRLWESYRRNLQYVLEQVEILLSNVDAERAVITADHGNAAGEWGVYGHPRVPIGVVRNVPWYQATATDSGDYTPTLKDRRERGELTEKLEALGYAD